VQGGVATRFQRSPTNSEGAFSSSSSPLAWLPVAAALLGTGWGSNQITPMLLVYRHTLALGTGTLEAMFGFYALGLIPGLLLAGPLSDARGRHDRGGKQRRLAALLKTLGMPPGTAADHLRYQLLHTTAAAVIEARRFNARDAMMVVHAFGGHGGGYDAYAEFADAIGATPERGHITLARDAGMVRLSVGWIDGVALSRGVATISRFGARDLECTDDVLNCLLRSGSHLCLARRLAGARTSTRGRGCAPG
jgi:MFS family permease